MAFRCEGILKVFPSVPQDIVALRDVNIRVREQEFVCLVGPSGCGKTTLLRIIAGLEPATAGRVIFDRRRQAGQLRAAMVFQDLGLFPWLTVLDNAAFGLEMQGVERAERHARAADFLGRVGLGDFLNLYPHELSGGMRQRTAIVRAFLVDSPVLLMDEPFGSLDFQTRLVMQEELLRIWREHRRTILYVTHDIEEAILMGDQVIVMSGRPGTIQATMPIDIERPRQLVDRNHPELAELRLEIWKMLELEVRREMRLPS